jgi:photosystem II stability/assembly factor-like uncharacterized protein
LRRTLVLAFVVLASTGWSSDQRRFGDLRVTAEGTLELRTTPRPHFAGPGRFIRDVAFLSPRVGVVVGGARTARTSDGGDTWREVWRGTGKPELNWLAAAGSRTLYAGGLGVHGRPFLVVSSDAGVSWKSVQPRLGDVHRAAWPYLRVTFVTPVFAYTVPDPAWWGMGAFAVTRDGGRTWRRLRVPAGTAGIQLTDARHGYAAGSARGRCAGAAWRTDDGGASWTRTLCTPVPLASVQFLDARRGFAGGGWPAVTEQAPSSVVYATVDGGATWQRRYADTRTGFHGGIYPIVELRFLDALNAWARTGQCKCCPSGPCVGEVLVTRDGGRTWARRGPEVELATAGVRDAWVLPQCDCNYVLRTRDAGRSWRPLARPDALAVLAVQAAGGVVTLTTEAGHFMSRDGRRWRFVDRDVLAARPGFSVESSRGSRHSWLVARHGRRAFRFAWPDDVDTVAVADATHAYAIPGRIDFRCGTEYTPKLFATDDGGKRWIRRRVPFELAFLAADGSRVAVVGVRPGCTNVLALSDDGARTWNIRTLPQKDCSVSVAGNDLWLGCGRKLLVSRDRGTTWTLLASSARSDLTHLAAAGGGAAWSLLGFGSARLFRTTDGGRTWLERWPRLPTP